MPASNNTIKRVVQVLDKHIPRSKAQAIVKELRSVDGNSSFKTTILALERELASEARRA